MLKIEENKYQDDSVLDMKECPSGIKFIGVIKEVVFVGKYKSNWSLNPSEAQLPGALLSTWFNFYPKMDK